MNIENITLNHSITIDEYNDLRASVDFITIRENRARIALDHRTSRRDLDDILLSMFFPGWKVRWMRERPLW